MEWTIANSGHESSLRIEGDNRAMNVVIGKTNPCALSVFALLLSLFAVIAPQVDGAEKTATPEPAEGVEAPGANESADAVGVSEAKEKTEGPVYLFHLARCPGFRYNCGYLQGSGDDDPDLESLFSFGLLGWELNIWRADHVTPGKYEFMAELDHESIFTSEYYERKPVAISQVPCVFWDCARFVPVPVTCKIDLPKADNRLLFGYMVTEKADAGNQPRCYIFPVFTATDEREDMEEVLWLNEEITNLELRFMLLETKYGTVAGKEFALGDAKSLRGKRIHVSIGYSPDGKLTQKEVIISGHKVPESDMAQGTVTITSPNGQSRVLK